MRNIAKERVKKPSSHPVNGLKLKSISNYKQRWIGKPRKECMKKRGNKFFCQDSYCKFAHRSCELRNGYRADPNFREFPCRARKGCTKIDCKFYHKESEKRESILDDNLNDLEDSSSYEIMQYCKKDGGGLDFSSMIPYLSVLNYKQVRNLARISLQCLERYEKRRRQFLSKNKSWHSLSLNLLRQNSSIEESEKERMITLWKDVLIVQFKSRTFSYERNSTKKQLSYEINTSEIVGFVCEDIITRKPAILHIRIKSVDQQWNSLVKIFEAIIKVKEGIRKLELDISELIILTDQQVIKKQLNYLFDCKFPLLKVLKLRFEIEYLNGKQNETQFVDIVLDCLNKFQARVHSNQMELSLNIFGIICKRKKRAIHFEAEKIRLRSLKNRKAMCLRLNHKALHTYFIQRFAKFFISPKEIKEFHVDFSNLFGLVKEPHRKVAAKQSYIEEISLILDSLSTVLNLLIPASLDRVSIRFFQFEFTFENSKHSKVSRYYLNYSFLLRNQNKPLLDINSSTQFARELKSKLRIINGQNIYSGNLFKKEFNDLNDYHYLSYYHMKGNIIEKSFENGRKFVEVMTENYKQIDQLKYFANQKEQLFEMILQKKQIFDAVIQDKDYYSQNLTLQYTNNVIMLMKRFCLIRKKIIAVFASIKKIQSKTPQFILREQILFEILKQQNLFPDDDLLENQILNSESKFSKARQNH